MVLTSVCPPSLARASTLLGAGDAFLVPVWSCCVPPIFIRLGCKKNQCQCPNVWKWLLLSLTSSIEIIGMVCIIIIALLLLSSLNCELSVRNKIAQSTWSCHLWRIWSVPVAGLPCTAAAAWPQHFLVTDYELGTNIENSSYIYYNLNIRQGIFFFFSLTDLNSIYEMSIFRYNNNSMPWKLLSSNIQWNC